MGLRNTIQVVGIDPSLRNTGIAIATVDLATSKIVSLDDLKLIRTEPATNKTQRKSSADYTSAREIGRTVNDLIKEMRFKQDCAILFAEIPSGTQSARASFALGITMGLMAGCMEPPIEVTPMQTKVHSIGIKTATKGEMIDWATATYPDAPWHKKGDRYLNSNEHLADAVGVIHAGLITPEWQMINMALKFSK